MVSGTVALTVNEPISYKHGKVTLIGEAKTKWSRIRPGYEHDDNPVYDKYESRRTVLHTGVTFRLKDSPGGLLEGSHRYQFMFAVPANCPSTFMSDDQGMDESYISYEINGQFVTGSADLDEKCHIKIPIKVRQIVDVNKSDLLVAKQVSGETKEIRFWCYNVGDIHFTAEIPRIGFSVVEDKIPLKVFVDNTSSRSVSFQAAIIQHHHYVTDHENDTIKYKTVKYETTVLTCQSQWVRSHTNATVDFPGLHIRKPKLETSLSDLDTFKRKYTLKITPVVSVPFFKSPSVEIEIVLGNVSFKGTYPNTEPTDASSEHVAQS